VKLRLKSSFVQVGYWSHYQIMAEIVSAAFGGKKEVKPDPAKSTPTRVIYAPKNVSEAKQMLARVLGKSK
jgi:hypothetical protein